MDSSFPSGPAVPPGAAPRGCTCARLRRLTRRITAIYDRELAATGLRVTQYSLLAVLRREVDPHGMPLSRLAERLDMDRTTLTRNLQPLTRRGLAALQGAPDDRRVRCVQITPAGRVAFEAAQPRWRHAQYEVERILQPDTVAALHQWLDTVTPLFRPSAAEEPA